MGLHVDVVDVDLTVADRFVDAVEAGLLAGAELWLAGANEHVPIEDEGLERSGVASAVGMVAAVSYDTPYAVRQHEQMNLHHDSGREAKWLEREGVTHADRILQRVADVAAERLGS